MRSAPKKRLCANPACGKEFQPDRMGQKACGWPCAAAIARLKTERRAKSLIKAEKRAQAVWKREKKLQMMTRSDWTKKAQFAFNRYIRERDRTKPCICCGQPLGDQRYGGAYDAGHYRSVGSARHMRFIEDNVHAQRKYCNDKLGGNHVMYRKGLIERIGLARVEALEADQSVRKYTIEDLIGIYNLYNKKYKDLLKETKEDLCS